MAGTSDEKTIKIGAKPDETGFRSAQRLVRDVRMEIEKLNQALGQMGRGILGGAANKLPINNGQAKMPTAAQAASPVVTLSKQLLDSKQLFQTIATGSKTALQTMTQALRTESVAQSQLVSRLRKEVDQLSASYQKMDDMRRQGIQLADPEAPTRIRGQMFQASASLSQAETLAGKLHARHTQMLAAGGGSFRERVGSTYDMLGSEMNSMASGWASRMGIGPTMQSLGGPAIIGAVIGKTIVNSMKSGMSEAGQAPWDILSQGQMHAGWGREALGVKGGDMTLMAAYRLVQANPVLARSFNDLQKGDSTGGPGGTLGFSRSATGSVAFDQEGFRRTMAAWEAGKRTALLDPVGGINGAMRSIDAMPSQMTADQLRFLQTTRDAFPLEFEMQRHFQSSAAGDVAAMRGLGMGPSSRRRLIDEQDNSRTSVATGPNHALRLMRSYGNRGIGRGEVMSAFQGIEGVAGLGAAQRYLGYGVQGNLGHLPGAAGIVGESALVGSAGQFFPSVANMVGRGSGGIDVGAAGIIGSSVGGTLANGAAPTSGLGLLGAAGAYARGADGAGDVLNARFTGAGIGAMGNLLGGRIDAYQRGTNILSAIQALPGGSPGAQEYLARIDPRVLFDVVGGGAVPLELQQRGISAAAVKEYAGKIMAQTYERALSPTPNQKGQLNGVQSQTDVIRKSFGGSFKNYVDNQAGMLSGKDREDFLKYAFVNRGAYLTEVGLASNDLEGQAFARLEAGMGQYATGRSQKGRGIGDPAGASVELAHEAKKSEFEGELEKTREAMTPMLRADIANAGKVVAVMANTASDLNTSTENVAKSLNSLATAIQEAERRIRSGAGAGRAGPAR